MPLVPRTRAEPVLEARPGGPAERLARLLGERHPALARVSRIATDADTRVRLAVWTVASVMVALVALSRLYRGMHHPLDLLGGVVVGVCAVFTVVAACRVAGATARSGGVAGARSRAGRTHPES